MVKNKKSVAIQKKKGNVVAGGDKTNDKVKKTKSGGILKKQHKMKKNKKAGDDNSAIKSTILTENSENVINIDETNGQKSNDSLPKKKGKKTVIDESVAGEVLSNPAIAKKSKKKIVDTVVETVSPSKIKKTKKKRVAQKDGGKKAAVEDEPTNETKNSIATDEEEDEKVEAEPISDKKRKKSKSKSKTTDETDEEVVVSPKKQKSKDTKTDDDTNDGADAKDKTPSISVFVGNLPVNTKRDKIMKLFSKFGKVKSIRFRLSNGTKFFKSQSKVTSPNVIAFVDFETIEDATSSLVLNGEKIKDNVIRVNLQSNAKSADSFDGKRTVFVGNLKYSVNDQTLHDLFSCCGEIEYARTMQCDKGCNGIGYVCFKKTESISMALELNNADLLGRPVRVQRYTKKTPGGPKEKKNKKEKPTGAVRRLGKKQKVKAFSKGKEPNSKTSFTGMKAKDKKKGFVKKSKKPLRGPKLLAKKIASRDKPAKAT